MKIIGQEEGLKALRAALCGPNPQHLLIYGPPGVGKTAAARVVLEEAKQNPLSPLQSTAKIIEVDATTARFDERGIADPLIGSVHDPIYQGAGMGMAGIPQPKPGAVTKAHGGILFIDEIGELHPYQMNKLLKVLEDRKVFFESAYYSSEDHNIPSHIHDIFQNGLPADFRLIGATTRQPHEIPPAIRSRCVEVFFRALTPDEIQQIAWNAVEKIGFELEEGGLEIISKYAHNGRDMSSLRYNCRRRHHRRAKLIRRKGIEWVVSMDGIRRGRTGKFRPNPVGYANGLAVYGPNLGMLVALEATAIPVAERPGRVIATGVIEEEEMGEYGRTIRRRSTARESVENVLTILKKYFHLDCTKYDLHINFPGGIPLDGPSAGIALVTVVYSALTGKPVDNLVAMTGEVSILGTVLPVGGIIPKLKAAKEAGAKRVLIPAENWQDAFEDERAQIIPPPH